MHKIGLNELCGHPAIDSPPFIQNIYSLHQRLIGVRIGSDD